MKICLAQTKPVTGDIQQNISRHILMAELAADHGAGAIIFPELSLTGYEPTMAEALAIDPADSRLDELYRISEARQIIIAAGIPTRHADGIRISLMVFQPGESRQLYSKRYLHADEVPYFISGPDAGGLIGEKNEIALAICYEIAVPEHAERAFNNGAKIYVASVAKFANGVDNALSTLSGIARKYSLTVLMANAIGPADGGICAGRSSAWNDRGDVIGQLDDVHEGVLVIDMETQDYLCVVK